MIIVLLANILKEPEGERLRALDIFSGCGKSSASANDTCLTSQLGGFSFGMSNAGIDINWAVDKEKVLVVNVNGVLANASRRI